MEKIISLDTRLFPPELPQSVNGTIDIKNLPQDNIVVIVKPYYNISTGDNVRVLFGEIASPPYIVLDGPTQGPMYFNFSIDNIPNGNYNVYYTAIDYSTNASYSPYVPILVKNSSCNYYPAPVFPDYPYNIIGIQSAIKSNGVTMRAFYSEMATGDIVTFSWRGTDMYGNDVPASYFTKPVTVDSQNVADKYVDVQIPLNNIIILENFGTGYASYKVSLWSGGGEYASSMTNAQIVWGDIDQLQISVTNGAPPRSSQSCPYLLTMNTGTVFGPPGASLSITATNGAVVADPNGTDKQDYIRLDEFGLGRFSIYTTSVNPEDWQPFVIAESTTGNLPKSANTKTNFYPYRVGTAGIKAYGFTTMAAADGISPCSIYILGDGSVQSIDAFGEGDFIINGRSNNIKTSLNADYSCTINIVSDIAQKITITLRGSDNLKDLLNINIEFIEPLSLLGSTLLTTAGSDLSPS
ncbi:hypothetical protein ABE530_14135 [Brucella sp. TWI559]